MNRLIDPLIPTPCNDCIWELTIDLLAANSDDTIDDAADEFFLTPFLSNN